MARRNVTTLLRSAAWAALIIALPLTRRERHRSSPRISS